MWAVGETDMIGLSIAATGANVSFGLGSFCAGFGVNILISYSAAAKLTEVGAFMLYQGTWLAGGAALAFYTIGGYLLYRKGSLWQKIKSESRQIAP